MLYQDDPLPYAQGAVIMLQHIINMFPDEPNVIFVAAVAIADIATEAANNGTIVDPLMGSDFVPPSPAPVKTESSTGPIQVFNDRELATVLHALRAFQSDTGYCLQGCDHFDEVEPLTNDEIDVLCERLNLAPESPVEPEGQDDPAHDSEGPDECARCGRNLEDDMTAEQRNGPPCSECGAGQEEITSPAQSVNRTIALAIVDEMQIDLTITPLELAQLSQWSEFQATLKK